jgi:polyisoprenoid-binding protein YceI
LAEIPAKSNATTPELWIVPDDQDLLRSQSEERFNVSTARASQVAISTWNIDSAHTVAEFKVKYMMITNVKGQFSGVSGTLSLDEHDVTNSKVEVTIP